MLRDGVRRSVPAASLVPGDIVLIEAGDRVPADLPAARARAAVDEALLTGESVPAARTRHWRRPLLTLACASMAYSGTLVAAGQGTMR